MANGISCAYFAGKNLINGKKEHNAFKKGIGGIQTVRTVDAAAGAAKNVINFPGKGILGTAAEILKKALYPLIILSGIFNTVNSDDKIKTGFNQACGIGTMYLAETMTEKRLQPAIRKFINTRNIPNNKILHYILNGTIFAAASLSGYNIGSKISDSVVDKIRGIKNKTNQQETEKYEQNIFEEMDIFSKQYSQNH